MRPDKPIRVFLIDDQAMIRTAFKNLVGGLPRCEVVGDSGDARAALAEIEQLRPEASFQRGDLLGRGGLRDTEQLRRRRHLAGLSHGNKDLYGLDEVAVCDGAWRHKAISQVYTIRIPNVVASELIAQGACD